MTHHDFIGRIQVRPALNEAESAFLFGLLESNGTLRGTPTGRGDPTVPFARLAWEVCPDGCCLKWNGEEDSRWMVESLRFVLDHLLRPGAKAEGHPKFAEFTFDHVLSGAVLGRGPLDRVDRFVAVVDDEVHGLPLPEPCDVPQARPLAQRSRKRPDNVIVFRPRRA